MQHPQEENESGGAGPNEQHALDVEQAIADDRARGFVLIGRNIGIEINGELGVYDYAIRDMSRGVNLGIKVKTTFGDTVRLSTRQVNLDTDLIRFGGVIIGTVGTGAPVGGVGYRSYCFFCDTVDMRSFRLREQLELYGIEIQRGKLPDIYILPRP